MTREEAVFKVFRGWTVGDLRHRLQGLPDDMEITVRGTDGDDDLAFCGGVLSVDVEEGAEIARLRGEIEKLRGVRVALADLQVSDEVRDQLAAIEREVREAHAEEIAALRAEIARLRAALVSVRSGIKGA